MRSIWAWVGRRCESILFIEYRRSAEALGLYRVAFALYWLVLGGVPSFQWIAGHPQAFFSPPPGLPSLFSGFPPLWTLQLLDLGLVVLFVALLVGIHVRAASLGIVALLLLGNSFKYSFGKIDHDILLVLTPLLFAGTWGRAFSRDARRSRDAARPAPGSSLALLAGVIAFGFFTAGLPKLLNWMDFDLATHGVKRWVLSAVSLDRTELLVPYFVGIESPWIWELLDIAAVAFEIGFVVALFAGPVWFRAWIGLAALFHLANYLMLNISFDSHIPIYMAFLDWETAASRVRASLSRMSRRWLDARLVWACGLTYAFAVRVLAWRESGDPHSLLDPRFELPMGRWRTLLILVAAGAVTLTLATRALLAHARSRRVGRATAA